MSKLRIAPVVLTLALVFAACGDSDSGNVATNDPTETTAASTGNGDSGNGGKDHEDGGEDQGAVGATVMLKELKFNPDKVTIKAGEAVKWEWDENVLHNVHGDDFESPNTSDGPYQHTFKKAGTYEYQCTLHAGMAGEVTVTG